MRKYTITIFDNETKNVEKIDADLMIVGGANVIGKEMDCVGFVDQKSSLEEIMRLYLAIGRIVQTIRVSEKYDGSERNVGDDISPNKFRGDTK